MLLFTNKILFQIGFRLSILLQKTIFTFFNGLILLLLIFSFKIFAQENVILNKKNENFNYKKADTNLVKILNKKARLIVSNNPEKALLLTQKALNISKNLSYPNGLALSLNGMGIAYYYLGEYKNALSFYEQSLLVYSSLSDNLMISTIYANIGGIYQINGDYNKAKDFLLHSLEISLKHLFLERTATTLGSLGILFYNKAEYASALNVYLKTLKLREVLNDKQGIAYTLSNIGLIYDDQSQYEKALSYYLKSLSLLNEIKDQSGLAATLNNIGLIYYNLSKPDTALEYFNESLDIARLISNKVIIRSCYNNIGDIYKSKEKYKLATAYFEKAQKINEELNDIKSKAITLNSIADLYKQQKNFIRALDGFKESLKLSEQIGDRFMVKENYKNLASLFALMNNYKLAYEHFQKYYSLNEDLFKESQRQLSEIQSKYENERIMNEVRLLKKEKEVQRLLIERNRFIIYTVVFGLVLLLFILIIIYRANKQKAKANEKLKLQNIVIARQKEEIASEKQRADNQILNILKTQDIQNNDTAFASIDDYQMVAALFKKMEQENIHSKIEILKSEVNPHFLFNSLNNLISLIEENQAVAANYVQELSSVYLYVLRSKEKELVELSDEITFAKSYSFLLFRRFGNNLIFNLNIDDSYYKYYVPPLCMELLIENAVKHNVVTSSKPLTLDIFVENNYLIVKNNLQLKNIPEPSTKIGLQNIEKRYNYLSDKKVEIIKTKRDFIVKLPLIKFQV